MFRSNLSPRPQASPSTPRSRGRRRPLLGAAAGLLALAALPGTASALNLSTVYFRSVDGQGNPVGTLDTWVVSNEQTCHFIEDDLAPQLTTTDLQKVMVQYWSDSQSAETHVFARDPAELAASARAEATFELFGDDAGYGWDPFIAIPSLSNDVSVPYDLVVPYPNIDTFSFIPGTPPLPAEVYLAASKFSGPVPHTLALPNPAVRGARMYDHGKCSASASLDDMYDEMQDGAWCELKRLARQEDVDVLRWYTHVITQLDRPENGIFIQVEDGFLMNAHFLVIVPDPGSDVDVHAKMESVFSLKDGHLVVAPKGTDTVLTHCTGAGGIFCPDEDVFNGISDAIGSLRDGIEKTADRQQSVAIGPCNPDLADPCLQARKNLTLLVEDGAATLEGQKLEAFGQSEIDAMQDAVNNPSLWTCDTGQDVIDKLLEGNECNPVTEDDLERLANPTCRLFLPASRLNVYPDEVELVWFDGKEVKNPAYALWVALQSPFAPDAEKALATMCAEQQNDYSEVDSYTREYASSQRGVMYASQDW